MVGRIVGRRIVGWRVGRRLSAWVCGRSSGVTVVEKMGIKTEGSVEGNLRSIGGSWIGTGRRGVRRRRGAVFFSKCVN